MNNKLLIFDSFSKNINRDKLRPDHNLVIYYIKHSVNKKL